MTVLVANVTQSTDTFGQWLTKTNLIASALSNVIVTTNSNTTTGNAAITGAFSSNAVYTNFLLGGNVSTSANLTVSTNTFFSANVAFQGRRVSLGLAGNVEILGATSGNRVLSVNTSTNTISVGKISINDISEIANLSLANNDLLVYNSNSASFGNTRDLYLNYLKVDTTANIIGNLTVGGTITATGNVVTSGSFTGTGNTTLTGNTNIGGNLSVGGNTTITGIATINGSTINSTSFSGQANSAVYFGGQLPAFYSNVVARLGYTPANKAGDTFTGSITVNGVYYSNGSSSGYVVRRRDTSADAWTMYSTSGNIQWFSQAAVADRLTLDSSGNLTATGDVIAFSDARLKEDIKQLESALDRVNLIRGVSYSRKDTGEKQIGVIAQEIESVVPEVVRENDEGIKGVSYGNLVALLIEAVKELSAEVERLKQVK